MSIQLVSLSRRYFLRPHVPLNAHIRMSDLSMKGFYHARTAQLALKEHDIDAAKDHYRKAGDFYIDAANKYPEDDEQHACKLLF